MSNDAIIDLKPVRVRKRQPKLIVKLAVVVVGALALLAMAGSGIWWILQETAGDNPAAAAGVGSSSYIEVPAITVNLRGGDGQARFLKLRFIIVAADSGKVDHIKDRLPVVLDALQPFLRELRPEDLAGSAAVFRIKEEMMARATQSLGAGMVRDVLIQDLLQQ